MDGRANSAERFKKASLTLVLAWVGLLSAFLLFKGGWPPWEAAVMVLLAGLLWRWPGERLWSDLGPFVLLLLSYQSMRAHVDLLHPEQVNVANLIAWERALFAGAIPAAVVQDWLYPWRLSPLLDLIGNALYLSHFPVPVIVGALLHRRSRELYWSFVGGFLALSYLGFATYLIFPAAPPWWATQAGILQGADAVNLDRFILSADGMMAGPNPLAAMPSLHLAYPLYAALVCRAVWGGRVATPLFLLPLGVTFAVLYLGHHYLIDVIAGAGYGLAVWALTSNWFAAPVSSQR